MTHEYWMTHALSLARRGQGSVEPNPMVGAVVVQEGQVAGEGWHQRYGEAHAEVHALRAAGEQARGATLYVTLEPCCHFGKTPPCTDAVLQAGIARVVVAMTDPFPQVAGGGLEVLRRAGVQVEVGVCESQARELNRPYLKLLSTGQPYLIGKWAMTLDGKIATHTGNSKWISNSLSREMVHSIRGRVDGIMVGAGTVRADDPALTARPPGPRTASRIVVTHTADIPLPSQVVQTARHIPTIIAVTQEVPVQQLTDLRQAGCEVLQVADVSDLLSELGRRRMTNVLVEGGGGLLGSLVDAELLDEVHVFLSMRVVGGEGAVSPVSGVGYSTVAESLKLHTVRVSHVGDDLHIVGYAGMASR